MPDKLKSLFSPRRKLAAILSISFSSAFMVFIYTPFDIYLHNPSDFVVSWRFMLLPVAAVFLLSFLALTIVLLFLRHKKIPAGVITASLCGALVTFARFALGMFSVVYIYIMIAVIILLIVWILLIKLLKNEAVDFVMLGMWGILVAAYIQTLFLNTNMEAIMGQQTHYSERSTGNIINLVIWTAITLFPLCIFACFKIKKKVFKYEKVFVLSLVIISGMQVAGLVSTAVSTDLPRGFDDDPIYFTYEATVNLSSDNNIVVFVLDSLDVKVVNNTFELFPHLHDYLDGFTHYTNNLTEHFDTIPSMVSMLTQHHISPGQDGSAYREEAWASRNYIDYLRENGFTTNLYLDQVSTFERYELIKDRTDNMRTAKGLNANVRHIIPTITRLSLGRLSPYLLKNTWLGLLTPVFGRTFFSVVVENYVISYVPVVSIDSDVRFHNFLMQSTFSADNEKGVFIMMHFNSSHAHGDINDPHSYGYHFDEASGEIRYGGSRWDVTRASFEKMNLYFNRMREIGVFDNSTIIITGDHGRRAELPEMVSLFIKPKGSTGALVTDSVTELSHKYFPASILDAAGVPHEAFGISYFDIINGLVPAPPVRTLYVVGAWTTPIARIRGGYGFWEVAGDANDFTNWTFFPVEPDGDFTSVYSP